MEEKQQYYKNYKELIEGYENDNGEHVDMSQPRDASYAEFKWDDDLKKEVLLKTHRLGSTKPLKSKLKGNMKMKNPYTYRDIPSEVRGITLRQLKAIIPMIKRRCDEEEWTRPTFSNGVKTDGVERISLENATLHDVNQYIIKPFTEYSQKSFVEKLPSTKGTQDPRWFIR